MRRIPFRLRTAALAVAAGALALALVLVSRNDAQNRPTLVQLAATNYRTLTPKQSRQLIRFAEAEYRCLSGHGLDISAPVASDTRITMQAPGKSARALAQAMFPCMRTVGDPPGKSSLQARRALVLVYLPKRCLLNPNDLPQT